MAKVRSWMLLAASLLGWTTGAAAQSSGTEGATAHPGPSPLRIGGFSDINFAAADNASGAAKGFSEGQLALHFNSLLAPQVTFFGEISLTARPATATAASTFGVGVERLLLKYDFSDALRLSAGRFHTPISWWNIAFHHGQWLQTSVARPEMTRFGGKFIPVHFVGVLAEGALPSGGLNLNYKAGVGNGRGPDVNDAGDAGSNDSSLAWLANLFVRPDAFYDLQLGAAYYDDRLTLRAAAPPPLELREAIASAYLIWLRESPEFLAEYARIRHRDAVGPTEFEHSAFYVQVGWRLPWGEQRWKPYARYEDMDIEAGDPVFAATPLTGAVQDRTSEIYGLRYDFVDYAALKGEYRRERIAALDGIDGLHLQVSFAF